MTFLRGDYTMADNSDYKPVRKNVFLSTLFTDDAVAQLTKHVQTVYGKDIVKVSKAIARNMTRCALLDKDDRAPRVQNADNDVLEMTKQIRDNF